MPDQLDLFAVPPPTPATLIDASYLPPRPWCAGYGDHGAMPCTLATRSGDWGRCPACGHHANVHSGPGATASTPGTCHGQPDCNCPGWHPALHTASDECRPYHWQDDCLEHEDDEHEHQDNDEPSDLDQLADLAARLIPWADENRLTLVARTLRDAIRHHDACKRSAAHIDPARPRRRLLNAIRYARRELRGDYDQPDGPERPTLTDLDDAHHQADAATLDALDVDDEAERTTAAWMTDPAAWLLARPFSQYAERMAAAPGTPEAVAIVHHLATQTAGGGGPGYTYQCDGGGITVATCYHDAIAKAPTGPRRRVTWVQLARRAQAAGSLF